ncbi:MAG: putative quinol monooxygenase [Sphingomonas sp.]
MIIVTGTARFGAGEVERLKPVLVANIAASRAEEGCLHYSYAADLSDPDLIHISEQWRDEAAVGAHMTAPHMARFMAELGAAKIEALSVKSYDATYQKTLLGG